MIHVQIQPGAIAAFESEPTPEAIKALRDVAEYFNQHPIDAFLHPHADEITEPYRILIRAAAVKAIQGADINLNHCPAHLRSELLGIIMDAAEYVERVAKQKFLTGKNRL